MKIALPLAIMSERTIDILIATNNPGKAREIAAVLSEETDAERHIRWHTLADLDQPIDEPVEDRDTFAGNSQLKATYYSKHSGMITLADDSGLEVDALNGAPGVHSAYYAKLSGKPSRAERDAANNKKMIAALQGVPDEQRGARFRCILTLANGDDVLAQSSGAIEGRIIDEPRGAGGFGYDPHFLVPELNKTTAELDPAHKNRISHRGNALRALRQELQNLLARLR